MNVYQLRPAHIQNLGMCFPQMQIKKINELFSVPFNCKGGLNFLIIFLPVEFPNVPPVLKVEKPMTHSIIANDHKTIMPNSYRFNPMIASLGTTVKDIVSKLTYGSLYTGPMSSSPGSSGYVSQPGSMGIQQMMMPGPQAPMQQNQVMARTLPTEDMISFEGLTEDQIRSMLKNKDEITKFIESLPSITSLKKEIEKSTTELETTKSSFYEVDYKDPEAEDISKLREEVAEASSKASALREKNNDVARNKKILRARMTELNKKTDAILEDFMVEPDVTVDEFADAYLADRVSYHKADIKFKALGKK